MGSNFRVGDRVIGNSPGISEVRGTIQEVELSHTFTPYVKYYKVKPEYGVGEVWFIPSNIVFEEPVVELSRCLFT